MEKKKTVKKPAVKKSTEYTLKEAKFDIDFAFAKIELLEATINDLNDIIKQDQEVINALQSTTQIRSESAPKEDIHARGFNLNMQPFMVIQEISKKQPTFWQSLFRIKQCK